MRLKIKDNTDYNILERMGFEKNTISGKLIKFYYSDEDIKEENTYIEYCKGNVLITYNGIIWLVGEDTIPFGGSVPVEIFELIEAGIVEKV